MKAPLFGGVDQMTEIYRCTQSTKTMGTEDALAELSTLAVVHCQGYFVHMPFFLHPGNFPGVLQHPPGCADAPAQFPFHTVSPKEETLCWSLEDKEEVFLVCLF